MKTNVASPNGLSRPPRESTKAGQPLQVTAREPDITGLTSGKV